MYKLLPDFIALLFIRFDKSRTCYLMHAVPSYIPVLCDILHLHVTPDIYVSIHLNAILS